MSAGISSKTHNVGENDRNSYNNIQRQTHSQLIQEDALKVIRSSSALSTLTAGSRQVNYLSVYTDADI